MKVLNLAFEPALTLASAGRRALAAIAAVALVFGYGATARAFNIPLPSVLCVKASGTIPKGVAKKLKCGQTIYTTISAAVGAASAGDSIFVLAGKYSEMVSIPAELSGLSLVGQNPKNTIIDATGQQNGVFDQADNVTIDGFTIENAEHEGILVEGPAASCGLGTCSPVAPEITGVTVSDNIVQNNDQALKTSTTPPTCPATTSVPAAPDFEQEDCGEGVHLDGVAFSTVTDNLIMDNSGGILLTDETNANHDNLVSNNRVQHNVPDCGITLPSHPPNGSGANIGKPSFGVFNDTVADNLSEGNGAAGTGVFAPTPGTASYKHLIVDNQLLRNINPGVVFHSHAPVQKLNDTSVVGNLIAGNGADPTVGEGETGPADPTGIEVYADPAASPIVGVKIVGNTIRNESNGVWVGASGWNNCPNNASTPCYIVDAHQNNFAPRSTGVNNTGAATDVLVNATNNFWGCGKGAGGNPACATASGNVSVFPFLGSPAMPR
jgi:parallel beta-helix repeat protein